MRATLGSARTRMGGRCMAMLSHQNDQKGRIWPMGAVNPNTEGGVVR